MIRRQVCDGALDTTKLANQAWAASDKIAHPAKSTKRSTKTELRAVSMTL
jgi:hypothetical protein